MEIGIDEYKELERLGLNIEKAKQLAQDCKNIRELEYNIYFNAKI